MTHFKMAPRYHTFYWRFSHRYLSLYMNPTLALAPFIFPSATSLSHMSENVDGFLGDFFPEMPFPMSENYDGSEFNSIKNMESISNIPTGEQAWVGDKRDRRGKKIGGGISNHEAHVLLEKERRKKMTHMFSKLRSLLPHPPDKPDKSTIIDDAVNYIQNLEQTLQHLKKRKRKLIEEESTSAGMLAVETPASVNWYTGKSPTDVSISGIKHCFRTWSSPNVVLNIFGEDAHISICTTNKPGLLTTIFCVMEKHNLDVVNAQISSDYFRSMYMIHVRVAGVSDQFPVELMAEGKFKLAVSEMLLWLST